METMKFQNSFTLGGSFFARYSINFFDSTNVIRRQTIAELSRKVIKRQ